MTMKKTLLLFCAALLLLSGCAMDLRKISFDPKITTDNLRKSSLRAGLVLDEKLTGFKHSFQTGTRAFMLSSVRGEMEIGKTLSQALYGIIASKFGNVTLGGGPGEMADADVYFVSRIKAFEFSPPHTGYGSYDAMIELETDVVERNGGRRRKIAALGRGSGSMLQQFKLTTTSDIAAGALNDAVDNVLKDFSAKLDALY
jgi:hypothetical protein